MRRKRILASIAGLAILGLLPLAPQMSSAERSALASKMFDLSAPAAEVFRDKPLHNGTVLQSFAFDNENGRVFTVQLMAGGQQLPGESAPVSGSARGKNGDLALTRLDLSGGETGHMFLKGFGHGVQIGVEAAGDESYLWTETDSRTEGSDGWGTQLARFKFEDGKILTPDSPELEKFRLIEGVDRTTVNIDPANGLLTMRYRKDGAFRFALFDLESVKRHEYAPLADVPQPSMGTFQGFASYGGYLYLLEGNSYGSNGSVEPTGNTFITCVDWQTGKVLDKQRVSAGNTLSFREPEGLAIRIPDVRHPQKAELAVGFASSFAPLRLANIYAFDRLLPGEAILNRH
jgi:hypothetical protein